MIGSWWSALIGRPFGTGPGEDTCWSLVRRVYAAQLGRDLPEYGEISARDLLRVTRAMEDGKDDGWTVPANPQEFDVVLMRSPRGGPAVVCHVGLLTDASHVLHVEAATACVRVPLRHPSVAGRILGFRRLA